MITVLLWVGGIALAAPAKADTATDEARFLALTNPSRTAAGLAPVAVAGDLTALARRHAADMAAQNRLFHTPNLIGALPGWSQTGEIVGFGYLSIPAWIDVVHQDFLASPAHRGVMLSGAYTYVGVGVAYGSGKTWVTEEFGRPGAGGAPAPPPVTAPRPSRSRIVVVAARSPARGPGRRHGRPAASTAATAASARPAADDAPPPPPVIEETPIPPVPMALLTPMPAKVSVPHPSPPDWTGRMMLGLLAVGVGGSVHRRTAVGP